MIHTLNIIHLPQAHSHKHISTENIQQTWINKIKNSIMWVR